MWNILHPFVAVSWNIFPIDVALVLVKWHKNVKNTSNLRENYVKTSLKTLIFNHFLSAEKVAKNEKFRENSVKIPSGLKTFGFVVPKCGTLQK